MKKLIAKRIALIIGMLLVASYSLKAQNNTSWSTSSPIGIGTTSPSNSYLHIYRNATTGGWGSVNHGQAGLRIQDSGASLYIDGNSLYTTTSMNIGTTGNNTLNFGTNNSQRITIKEDGRVGIGTNAPEEELHIIGQTWLEDGVDSKTAQLYFGHTNSFLKRTGSELVLNSYNRRLRLKANGTNGEIQFFTDGAQRFEITEDGKIGIGVNTPTEGLVHIYRNATTGGVTTADIANATLKIEDSSNSLYIDGNALYTTGNMILGTMADNTSFSIGTNNAERMRVDFNGNVGIGVTSPSEPLEVNGTTLADNFRTDQNNTKYSQIIRNGNGTALYVNQVLTNKPIMRLSSGTSSPNEGVKFSVEGTGATRIGEEPIPDGYMLAVDGAAIMTEVKVEVTPWPDYVFTPSYNLQSLEEVETFINENGHLPNIPSATEVQEENGIELGQMNAKLLEKIEELTLHLIEKDKQLKTQDSKLETLEQVLEVLQNQNTELIKRIEKIESSVEK